MEYIHLAKSYLSLFTDNLITFFNNGLVIALAAAWFSIQLNNLTTGYQKYCEHLSSRLFVVHNAISTIINNKEWIYAYEANAITLEQLINLTKPINFNDCKFTQNLDKVFFTLALTYNRSLVIYINGKTQAKKLKKKLSPENIDSINSVTIKGFEALIEIYENNLSDAKYMYINTLIGKQDQQQKQIQEELAELAANARRNAYKGQSQE